MRPVYLVSKTSYPGVIHLPVLAIELLHPTIDFSLYDGLIITSKQGAMALKSYECDWERLDVICVGEATAKEMQNQGALRVHTVEGYGDNIAHFLAASDKQWLYLRPESIASSWPDKLRQTGVSLDEVIIYRTSCNESAAWVKIKDNGILIFTSPSSIECFQKHYTFLPSYSVIVIGKTTQNSLPSGVSSYLADEVSVASCVELAAQINQDSSPF